MSIAVSAVVKPSRLLCMLLIAYAISSGGAAIVLAFVQPERFQFPILIAFLCMLSALAAGHAVVPAQTTRRIDISGLGEIRLLVQHSMGSAQPNLAMRLLPGSTVWPSLLLLLLRDGERGAVTVVAILPDSVPAEQFRKIAVALRAIARRDNKFFRKHKIL